MDDFKLFYVACVNITCGESTDTFFVSKSMSNLGKTIDKTMESLSDSGVSEMSTYVKMVTYGETFCLRNYRLKLGRKTYTDNTISLTVNYREKELAKFRTKFDEEYVLGEM